MVVGGDEAHHAARVKRCAVGDAVDVLNGMGVRGESAIAAIRKSRDGWELELEIRAVQQSPRPRPRLEVFAAAAKGERLEEMIDGLSQVGADVYRPLLSKRTVVDPREGKLTRLRRVAHESMKQCGRTWAMEIGEPIAFKDALSGPDAGTVVLAADATGGAPPARQIAEAERVILLVGPEGGFSEDEFTQLKAADVPTFRFSPHVLRVETAAVVGAALLRTLSSPR